MPSLGELCLLETPGLSGFRKQQKPVAPGVCVGGAGKGFPHTKLQGPLWGVPSGISNYRSYFCPADYVVPALGMRNESSHY